jgi:hypothetical protein
LTFTGQLLNDPSEGMREAPMPILPRNGLRQPGRSAVRGIAWLGGVVAWSAAAVTGAILAVFAAATVVVITVMAVVLVGLAAAALRARRSVRAPDDAGDLLEARNVGGHAWVAYGWDGRR